MKNSNRGPGAGSDSAPHSERKLDSAPDVASTTAAPISPQLAQSRQSTETVWKSIKDEFGLLTDREVSELLGTTPVNWNTVLILRNTGQIIAVNRRGFVLHPGFQFDRATRTVLPVVEPLLELARVNEWSSEDLTLWMVSPSTSFAEGDRPADHLRDPTAVLAAARLDMKSR